MTVEISYHSNAYGDTATNSRGGALDILGPIVGNAQSIAVGASAANSTPVTDGSTYLVKITPVTAARIAIGASATATSNSEYFAAGIPEVRSVNSGERISVIEA